MPSLQLSRVDPVLKSSLREAAIVAGLWLSAAIYSVGMCGSYGYGEEPWITPLWFGFPAWIFWGVVVPWVSCAGISAVISLLVMQNDDLGSDPEEAMREILGDDENAAS